MMIGGHRHVGLQMHTRGGATLLNFRSSLHSRFRFGLNRHKFATGDIVLRYADARRSTDIASS
jgi:hypothetical protein